MKQLLISTGAAMFLSGIALAGTIGQYQFAIPTILAGAALLVIGLEKK